MEVLSDSLLSTLKDELYNTRKKVERTERLEGLPGVLMARIDSRKIEFYYKFQWNKKRELLLIGNYSPRLKDDCVTLQQAIDKASEFASLRKVNKNPKVELQKELAREQAELNRQILEAENKGYGTFGRLLKIYEDSHDNEDTRKDINKAFRNHIRKPAPELLVMQARDIEWDHLQPLFQMLLDEGKGPTANLLLAYTKAAFNKMMRVHLDDNIGLGVDKEFNLVANPLQNILQNSKYKNPGKEDWSREELSTVWHNAVMVAGPVMGRLIRFVIACAGQRINQTVRVPWRGYYLDAGQPYFEIENMKRKRGGKAIAHIVPLNPLAMRELQALKEITGHCRYPFAGKIGSGYSTEKAVTVSGVTQAVTKMCSVAQIRHLTLGATRTTAKTMMGPLKIPKHIKNMLHSHGSMDVSDINYDKYDYFEEKAEAMELWNGVLEGILKEHQTTIRR